MKLDHCRSCRAPIIWTLTSNGKRMPVDADPIVAPRGFRLEEEVLDRNLQYSEQLIAKFTAQPEPGERVYQSHFATCPKAAQHRRAS